MDDLKLLILIGWRKLRIKVIYFFMRKFFVSWNMVYILLLKKFLKDSLFRKNLLYFNVINLKGVNLGFIKRY